MTLRWCKGPAANNTMTWQGCLHCMVMGMAIAWLWRSSEHSNSQQSPNTTSPKQDLWIASLREESDMVAPTTLEVEFPMCLDNMHHHHQHCLGRKRRSTTISTAQPAPPIQAQGAQDHHHVHSMARKEHDQHHQHHQVLRMVWKEHHHHHHHPGNTTTIGKVVCDGVMGC